jgi:iron-sulfur cluster assembly protein
VVVLTLTDNAAQVIRSVSDEPEVPPDTGLRIASGPEGSGSLSLSVTAGPEAGDEVVESHGVRVYLESEAAEMLNDKTLDAEVDEHGDVAFLIGDQSSQGG